jgi:cell volume regulation protein A
MLVTEHVLVAAGLLLLVSVLGSKAAGRLGVPALLLFLLIGMLAGSEGPGGIALDDPHWVQSIGVVALSFILFAGGLETRWHDVRTVLLPGLLLSTLGVLLTALCLMWPAHALLGFTWLEAALLGSIIACTDAAAVFSVLRSSGVGLAGRVKALLELESGSNDPMAVFLTVGLLGLLTGSSSSWLGLLPLFLKQMGIGAALGYGIGRLAAYALNHLSLAYEGLYPVVSLALVLLAYGATTALGGNGFLAVYLAGLVLSEQRFLHKASLTRYHDALAWLMQIVMFLVLGLQVFPSRLLLMAPRAALIAAFLMLVARPAAVFVSLAGSALGFRERLFVSWVGLRGAAPIVLATFPLVAGVARAPELFDVVFFIVLASALFQGTSTPALARRLGLQAPAVEPKAPLELAVSAGLTSQLVEIRVPAGSSFAGRRVLELNLPEGALIVLIGRGPQFFVPGGGSLVQAGDRLLLMGEPRSLAELESGLEAPRA